MLNPRSIAVGGVGFGARAVAALGFWPSAQEQSKASSIGSRHRSITPREDDDLIERVLDKWEAIERASLSPGHGPAETSHDGRHVPQESLVQPERSAIQIDVGNALPVAHAATDVALAPLAPDAAKAAIEARRKNNEAALLLLLMDL